MRKTNEQQKVTLEALLRVKREETPDQAFWNSFESEFQRRRLHALVGKPTLRERLWTPTVKAFGLAIPLLALAAITVFQEMTPLADGPDGQNTPAVSAALSPADAEQFVQNTPEPADSGMGSTSTTTSRAQFVVDALQEDRTGKLDFRKILYTPAIRVSSSPHAKYVEDSFRSGGYQMKTADQNIGRNF